MKPSNKSSRMYLEDILDAILHIEKYTKDGREKFFARDFMQDAVIRQMSIIGEAASKLPASLKSKNPDISWHQIIGMRNVIVHEYSGIKIKTIWDSVKQDLPLLKSIVEKMLNTI